MSKTLKKSLALILSIVMLMGVIPMGMSFAAETEGGYVYEVADGKATIVGYTGSETNIVIPATLGGYPVVRIGADEASRLMPFHSNETVVSVTIPDSVECIGYGAFYKCTALETVIMGDGVKVIEKGVFRDCSKLVSIVLSESLTTIELNAFGGCSSLTTINFRGTIAQWNALRVGVADGNDAFLNATVVYCYGMNCEHSNATVTSSATCTTPGTKTTTCNDCGYVDEEPAAAGHKWNYDAIENYVTSAPTCTVGANAIVPCGACDATTIKWVPALGHTVAADDWKVLEDATCTDTGFQKGTCEVCNKTIIEETPVKDHTENTIPAKTPTCTEAGYTVSKYCTTCETWTVVAKPVPALDHSYVKDEDESSDATCEVAGVDVNVCERCGNVKFVGVSALGHDIVTVNAKAPDCENGGWNAYEYCTRCNYTTYVAIPANGHTPGAAATCTTAQTCTDCDYVYAQALKHSLETLEGYDAGCSTTGLSDGVWCTVCEVVLKPQEVRPALNHKYVTTIERKEATCTEDGHTAEETCSRCNIVGLKSTKIPAKGHKKGAAATCTTDQKCENENCDYVYVPAYGHKSVDVTGYAATCTEDGLSDGKMCQRCYKIFVEQEVITALGHDMQKTADEEDSTCTTVGKLAVYTCARGCGHKEGGGAIAKKDHTPGSVATCTEDQTCVNCDYVFVEAFDHTPGVAATCTLPQTCSRCAEVLVTALGHDYIIDDAESKEATCLEDGHFKAICSVCDDVVEETVKATGHSIQGWTIIKYPTCQAEGQTVGLCENCKYNIKKTLPAVEHKDDDKNNKCDYCGGSMGATSDNPSKDEEEEKNDGKCTCLCHAVGIKGLIYDFILMIQRLFGLNRTCKCGEAHY